ncbi:DUF2281 domain-containing protein [Aerosakkonemataceae cyanobacterium BLCC-F154]|uniref:DUF2281 domain-containing protein n=1 Tax=Floridaenema fluviatile BLCC-F154 TaxID=3153640 RepID=A0ABV4Y6G4_9CYAN
MSIKEQAIAKIHQMPESLVQEVSNFIDFLLLKRSEDQWQLWLEYIESKKISESDFSDYLANLEDYENRLARGEIQW